MSIYDYLVMGVSLVLVLLVGWVSTKRTGNSTSFLTADKNLNKLQVGFSMAATDFGGSGLVGAIGYCYIVGMGGVWWNLAAAPAFLFVGLFLARKLNSLEGATVPDYLGNRYCLTMKYLAGFMHICANIAMLSSQFTISSSMLQAITNFDPKITLFISVILVMLLTSGGLITVINTDAAMFVLIVLSIFMCIPVTFHAGGGLSSIIERLPNGFMNFGSIGLLTPLSWFILCTLFYSTNQTYVQRMVSAKDEGTAVFAALFTSCFYLIISVMLGLIGITAASLIPGIRDVNLVFPTLLMKYFPNGLAGLSVVGVFAATISTGTSLLHANVVLFINDIWKPTIGKTKSARAESLISRATIIVIALFSTITSLFFTNIISIIYTAGLFYGAAVFAPLIMGINSKRPTANAALISSVCAVVSGVLWEFIISPNSQALSIIPSNIVGLAVSFILLVAVTYLENRRKHGAVE